ncbi:hypothetical protein I312_104784 [Cryptococcus bacillisporus CA1280]|uniref:uncharacterized protein n=1 Tax=Cryptococcus bacillisporus CA1280 TaxID=1296109 RepID=UPI0033661EB3
MVNSFLLSPSRQSRHSNFLQSISNQPTGTGNNTGFKASLRKIPSALFHKDKTPVKKKPGRKKLQVHSQQLNSHMGMSPSLRVSQQTLETDSQSETETKAKQTKPRKGLAELFGWSNHSYAQSAQPAQPAQSGQPSQRIKTLVPVPTPKESMMFQKHNGPPSTKSNSSRFLSLRPPAEPAMPSRPSMGDDPFMRPEEGAEVVDHFLRHGTPSLRSMTMLDKRSSVTSSKALSCKTTLSDERSIKEVHDRPYFNPTMHATQQSHVSAPPSQTTSNYSSYASISKAIGSEFKMFAPLPEVPEASMTLIEPPKKTLRKERTKSKVWVFLGRSKSKMSKKSTDEPATPLPLVKDTWNVAPMPRLTQSSTSLINKIDEKYPAATTRSNYSSFQCSKHPLPSLRVSQSSVQHPAQDGASGASTIAVPHSADRALFDSPFKHPLTSGMGGVWESIVGSAADRPSKDGPRAAIEGLMRPIRLPKRKSLSSLFGLGARKNMDKTKPSSPIRAPSSMSGQLVLESLTEEVEESAQELRPVLTSAASDVFTSRLSVVAPPPKQEKDGGLRRVASATDKLLSLVHVFDFSPVSSNSPTLHLSSSSTSLRQGFDGSPTPIRKIRSAVLIKRPSANCLRPPSVNVSPLKLALHRSQAVANKDVQAKTPKRSETIIDSPPRQSMVRKGMRNIFAPPSPMASKYIESAEIPTCHAITNLTNETVSTNQILGPNILHQNIELARKVRDASDVPFDLKAIVANTEAVEAKHFANKTVHLGLPAAPPQNRISSRRPGPSPPALSLPPVPNAILPEVENISRLTPEVKTRYIAHDSMFLDTFTADFNENRNSFDFTSEYQALDQGTQRASFVEALKKVGSVHMFMGGGLPPMPAPATKAPVISAVDQIPSLHIQKPSDITTQHVAGRDSDDSDEEGEEFGDEEAFEHVAEIHHVMGIARTSPVRREPFKGQVAFQQHMCMKQQRSHASFGAPEAVTPMELPPIPALPPVNFEPGGHKRAESSVATMSSIGSVIGTGTAGEYTNYFDYVVPSAQSHSRQPSVAESVGEVINEGLPRHSPSRESLTSFTFGARLPIRPVTRRGHHRRNSSIQSVGSVGASDYSSLTDSGPPVSMHNNRRSSYVSKHRRNVSSQSSLGRTDWAAHRRNTSAGSSTCSNTSMSQILRPGIGDRMFQLDGGVQLTSITGSPPDDVAKASMSYQRSASWDSLFDMTCGATATNVTKSVYELGKCLQGSGEDMSNITPLGKKKTRAVGARQMLGSTMARPPKPGRRRPAEFIFADVPVVTPGLTSPSASETSSRLSLDTNAASFSFGTRARGHCRQASCAQVNIDATIHEMPSLATLRPNKSSTSPAPSFAFDPQSELAVMGVETREMEEEVDRLNSVRTWVQWEREAVDEFRKAKNVWMDSEESSMAISDWNMPQTTDEIAAFLAQSSQAYKPLEQLPVGRIAHRRKSSLSDARSICSPYGLPLPKPAPVSKPKMSLTTKYEKKSSTGSKASTTPSAFSFAFFPDDAPEAPASAPISAPFATGSVPFARETPWSPPPKIAAFKRISPFQLPVLDTFGVRKYLEDKTMVNNVKKANKQPERKRVDSKAKRQALGWGRKRDSDGPEMVMNVNRHVKPESESKLSALKPRQLKPLILPAKASARCKKKENVYMEDNSSSFINGPEKAINKSRPLKGGGTRRSPAKRKPVPRYVASQPSGLRV